MNYSEKAIREYLENLDDELGSLGIKTNDAVTDASEFLAEEAACLAARAPLATSDEVYAHFVDVFGSPREVASGYIDAAPQPRTKHNTVVRTRRSCWTRATAAILLLGSTVGLCIGAATQEPPKLSPFTEVRFEQNGVVVRFRGELYDLVSLDEIPAEKLLQTSRDEFGNRWQKRFAEDLVEVLWSMKHFPKSQVKLELRNCATGKPETFADAAMTEANRRKVWEARNPDWSRRRSEKIDRQAAVVVINEFATALRERWSYYPRSSATIDSAIDRLRENLPGGITTDSLALELQKVIAHGIDGHASVVGWKLESGYLPFLIEPTAGKFVAFQPNREQFVDDAYPYIAAIDGRPIAEWCAAASVIVPKGSPQYIERHALRHLRNIQHWRTALGLPKSDTIALELHSLDGKRSKRISVSVSEDLPIYGTWPKTESRILDGNIGYLRLAKMDDVASREIGVKMPLFRSTNGLVVDVRDNGGGSREPLRLLASYLLSPDASPRVINCAKYRLYPDFPADQLASRFMFRADDSAWTRAERAVIAQLQKSFQPDWTPPADQFSDWHYMVLARSEDPVV